MGNFFALRSMFLFSIACVFSSTVRCQTSFPLHAIYGANVKFSSISKSDCMNKCPTSSTPAGSSRVIAVSYSSVYQQCMVTYCINVKLRMIASWDTIICPNNNFSLNCSALPTPMYDWMLTDTCGFVNTGWLDTGVLMQPVKYWEKVVLPPSAYSLVRTPTTYGDAAYVNPGLTDGRYMLMAQVSSQVIDPAEGFTVFSYVWFNRTDDSNRYAVYATGLTAGLGQSYTYQCDNWYIGPTNSYVWIVTNGWTFGYATSFQPYTWHYIATIYDPVTKNMTVNVDGTQFTATPSVFTAPLPINSMFIGTHPEQNTPPGGASYCFKVYRATLTAQQIAALAASCLSINVNVI